MAVRDMNRKQRFWSHVAIGDENDCWHWTGGCSGVGYGQFKWGYENGKAIQINSHRVAWMLTNGLPQEGAWVLHTCDNRKCCNPNHLYLGDRYDNYKDMVNRKRARNASWPFTDGFVERVLDLRRQGIGKRALARYFGASINTIRKACRLEK